MLYYNVQICCEGPYKATARVVDLRGEVCLSVKTAERDFDGQITLVATSRPTKHVTHYVLARLLSAICNLLVRAPWGDADKLKDFFARCESKVTFAPWFGVEDVEVLNN
jgi:hypothetical protein